MAVLERLNMTNYEFWALVVMLAIAILSNAINYLTARIAREKDREKMDAISKSIGELKTSIERLGTKYLKIEKDSREVDITLKTADLLLRAGGRN